jgi:ParB family chromosome partitioning protein
MTTKRGLGRGLDALLPTKSEIPASGVTTVAISNIARNPRQPRLVFKPEELEDLANSIREHGVIQPLIVAQTGAGHFTLIAGERRLEASKLAGLTTVPVIVREASDQQLLEIALIENIQRSDLGAIETALAYKQLADDFNLSHEQISARVGKKRVTVTNTLRLLKLPDRLQEAVSQDAITEGHARALLTLPTSEAQLAAFDTIQRQSLTVRQTEELVRRLLGQETKPARPAKTAREAQADDLTAKLRERLGTKVTFKRARQGGVIALHFYSDEELNALTETLLK